MTTAAGAALSRRALALSRSDRSHVRSFVLRARARTLARSRDLALDGANERLGAGGAALFVFLLKFWRRDRYYRFEEVDAADGDGFSSAAHCVGDDLSDYRNVHASAFVERGGDGGGAALEAARARPASAWRRRSCV